MLTAKDIWCRNGWFLCRDEIAGCSERAYGHLSVAEAKKMLLFKNDKEVLDYAAEV